MNNKIKNEINKLKAPKNLHSYVIKSVEKAAQEMEVNESSSPKKTKNIRRKITYIISAAVLFLSLFIGSIYTSPTVAAFVSEVSFLSNLFNLRPISELVYEELEDDKYNLSYINELSVSYFPSKVISLNIAGPDGYYEQVSNSMKQLIEKKLNGEGYDDFKIEITENNSTSEYILTGYQKKEKNNMEKMVYDILNNHEINPVFVYADPLQKNVHLQVKSTLNTKDDLREESESIKNLLIEESGDSEYEFLVIVGGDNKDNLVGDNITSRNTENLKHFKAILLLIQEFVGENDYKVSRIAHNGSEPVNVFVYTTVESSNIQHGKFLENNIRNFLESEEIASISDVEYNIIIYSKDKKVINE